MRFAKNTQHDTSKVLRLPRKMAMDTSKVLRLLRKLQHIFWKRRKSIAPATQNDFRHVPEHVWMSRSATPATRNEAKTRLKPPKRTTSVKLPIGTAIRSSRGRLRTVANGCGRLRPQTQRRANTPSTPRPPEWNGNPCYAFGKTPVPFVELPSIFFSFKNLYPQNCDFAALPSARPKRPSKLPEGGGWIQQSFPIKWLRKFTKRGRQFSVNWCSMWNNMHAYTYSCVWILETSCCRCKKHV